MFICRAGVWWIVEQALAAAYGHRIRIMLPTREVASELFKFCKLNYDYRISHEE